MGSWVADVQARSAIAYHHGYGAFDVRVVRRVRRDRDALAQAPATTAPRPLWTVTGLAGPSSAYYHQQSNSIFVSNYSGSRINRDGKGYITRIGPNGEVPAEKWATGLNAPKGIRSVGSTIWVVDIDEVLGFEVTADHGRLKSRVRIDGALSLNDLATTPDGTIFVSEGLRHPAPLDNPPRIYTIKDGEVSIFAEGDDAGWLPIGLLVDGDRLIVERSVVAWAKMRGSRADSCWRSTLRTEHGRSSRRRSPWTTSAASNQRSLAPTS